MTVYGSFSDGYENAILDHVLQGGASPLTPPANIYVGLSTADPLDDGSGLAEPSGGGYARVLWSNWTTPADRAVSNNGSIVFPKASAGWGTITHWFLVDAASGGNIIAQGPLAASKTVNIDNVFALASGEAQTGWFAEWKLYFSSGGTNEIQVGDVLAGEVSGATVHSGDRGPVQRFMGRRGCRGIHAGPGCFRDVQQRRDPGRGRGKQCGQYGRRPGWRDFQLPGP